VVGKKWQIKNRHINTTHFDIFYPYQFNISHKLITQNILEYRTFFKIDGVRFSTSYLRFSDKNTSEEAILPPRRFLFFVIIFPAFENTRSDGTLVPCNIKYLGEIFCNFGYDDPSFCHQIRGSIDLEGFGSARYFVISKSGSSVALVEFFR